MSNKNKEVLDIVNIANQILEGEEFENAEKFLDDLYDIYDKINSLSNRVLRTLRLQMPYKNSKVGLSNFIESLFIDFPELEFKQVKKEVYDNFEYTVGNKAISDSLHWLVKNKRLTNNYDIDKKKNIYRKRKTRYESNRNQM